jgi:hypothetical protein
MKVEYWNPDCQRYHSGDNTTWNTNCNTPDDEATSSRPFEPTPTKTKRNLVLRHIVVEGKVKIGQYVR